jgi:hypothetical protein
MLDGDYDVSPGIGDFVVTLGEVSELAGRSRRDPSTTLFGPTGRSPRIRSRRTSRLDPPPPVLPRSGC